MCAIWSGTVDLTARMGLHCNETESPDANRRIYERIHLGCRITVPSFVNIDGQPRTIPFIIQKFTQIQWRRVFSRFCFSSAF